MIYRNGQIRNFWQIRASRDDHEEGLNFVEVYDEGGTKRGGSWLWQAFRRGADGKSWR